MVLIQVRPQTTWRDSARDPHPADGPYVPYDFSQMTLYDLLVPTLLDNGLTIFGSAIFFGIVQYFAFYLLAAVFGDRFLKKRTPPQQVEDCVRVVSIVNGLIASWTSFLFLRNWIRHDFQLADYPYQPLEGYGLTRSMIIGYFVWDIVVCIRYKWGAAWTIHGICSCIGTYGLAFPFTDHLGAYFTGMFELSNVFLHTATLLRTNKRFVGIAPLLEYIFAALYLVIRVIGGTYITYAWMSLMYRTNAASRAHSPTFCVILTVPVVVIMLLQYIWFSEIVKMALGLGPKENMHIEDHHGEGVQMVSDSAYASPVSAKEGQAFPTATTAEAVNQSRATDELNGTATTRRRPARKEQ